MLGIGLSIAMGTVRSPVFCSRLLLAAAMVTATASAFVSLPSAALCPFAAERQGFVRPQPYTDAALLLRAALSAGQGTPLDDVALVKSVLKDRAPIGDPVALAALATRIRAFIEANTEGLDIDGDRQFTLIDATVIARYLLGFQGAALKQGLADTPNATRRSGTAMQSFIGAGCTTDAPLAAWNAFQLALIAGDVPRARSMLTGTAAENFGGAMVALVGAMPTLIDSFSAPIVLERDLDTALIAVSRSDLSDPLAQRKLQFVTLIKKPDGVWLIDAL